MLQIKEADIDGLEWLRAARGYEVKVMMQDGNIAKFDGFKESVSWRPVMWRDMCLKCGSKLTMEG